MCLCVDSASAFTLSLSARRQERVGLVGLRGRRRFGRRNSETCPGETATDCLYLRLACIRIVSADSIEWTSRFCLTSPRASCFRFASVRGSFMSLSFLRSLPVCLSICVCVVGRFVQAKDLRVEHSRTATFLRSALLYRHTDTAVTFARICSRAENRPLRRVTCRTKKKHFTKAFIWLSARMVLYGAADATPNM